MMSARAYKSLLLIMAVSQLMLLMIFWRQQFPSMSEIPGRKSKRSSCDCKDDLFEPGYDSKRFKTEEANETKNIITLTDSENRLMKDLEDSSKNKMLYSDAIGHRVSKTNMDVSHPDRPVLLVAIVTARRYRERRQAVRETWLQDCDSDRSVICRFFTDAQDGRGDPVDKETLDKLYEESAMNRGDLVLLNSPSGTNFSLRLLALFEWAKKNIKFDFLLRIDDDHFLCLDRLLKELPFRPRRRLYWGHLHCHAGIVRIDEGMMILTADLVSEFFDNKDKLMCHKYGDQAVAMWIYKSMKKEPVSWFGDARVHHDPPASYLDEFRRRKEICHTFISLHGSYPSEMREFQRVIDRERRNIGTDYAIPPIVDFCPYRRDYFDWFALTAQYRAKPVPCKDEPIWVSKMAVYQGRTSNNINPEPTKPLQLVKIQRVNLRYFSDNKKKSEANNDSSFKKVAVEQAAGPQLALQTQENIQEKKDDGIMSF